MVSAKVEMDEPQAAKSLLEAPFGQKAEAPLKAFNIHRSTHPAAGENQPADRRGPDFVSGRHRLASARGYCAAHVEDLKHLWQPLLKASGLSYRTPHALRHSYASLMLQNSGNLAYSKE